MKVVSKFFLISAVALSATLGQARAGTFLECKSSKKGFSQHPYVISFSEGNDSEVTDIATVVPVEQGQATAFKPVVVERQKAWPEAIYSASTEKRDQKILIEITEKKNDATKPETQFRAKLKLISSKGELSDPDATCIPREVPRIGS